MICALYFDTIPSRNAAIVPGSLPARSPDSSSSPSAVPADSASSAASSLTVNSSQAAGSCAGPCGAQPGAGRRRMNSATAACLRAAAYASTRSHALIAPATSSSAAPAYRHRHRRPRPRTRPAPAPRHGVQRHPGAEPGRPAQVLTRGDARRPGLARPAACERDGLPAGQAQPGGAGRRGRLLRGDLPALGDDRVQVVIPWRPGIGFLLIEVRRLPSAASHQASQSSSARPRTGTGPPGSPAGSSSRPGPAGSGPWRHAHHPFG